MASRAYLDYKDFKKAIQRQVVAVDKVSERIVRQGGEVIARRAKEVFLGAPVKNPIPNKRKLRDVGTVEPSWPRPTNRSGHTRDSIQTWDVDRIGHGRWASRTYPTTVYARRLELGGTSINQVFGKGPFIQIVTRPFPYLSPGLDKAKPEIRRIYKTQWAEALKNA